MCLLAYAGFLRCSGLTNACRSRIVFWSSYSNQWDRCFAQRQKFGYILYQEPENLLVLKLCFDCIWKQQTSQILTNAIFAYLWLIVVVLKHTSFVVNALILHSYKKNYDALGKLGLDKSKYGLHSLPSGGASTAANVGVSDRLLNKHGRCLSENAKDG